MAVWDRIQGEDETWPEMEDAAHRRFWDGLTLACADEHCNLGAVYLWGYVAEILLKTACLRVRGTLVTEDVDSVLRDEHLFHHRLRVLRDDLRLVREAALRPIDPVVNVVLGEQVDRIAANWSEVLRYRSADVSQDEVEEVYKAVEWFIMRHSDLV